MASPDWVGLVATLAQEGVKALLPGSGVALSATASAMQPELDRARKWLEDRREQRQFADLVEGWATRNGISEADIDSGMAAAASILRQSGAGLDDLVRFDLDAVRIANHVLSNDPVAQRNLGPGAQEVCSQSVAVFYERLLARTGLSGASLKELLRRSSVLDDKMAQLGRQIADLRVSSAQDDRSRRLEETMRRIGELETAQSEFRWVTGPEFRPPDIHAIGIARRHLVTARVGLEASARRLADPALRNVVLAFVEADEEEDKVLRSGTSDPAVFAAIRTRTIQKYVAALDAVARSSRA